MKRMMMLGTVAATMAAMMALSGAALAQEARGGGDVCLSQGGQTIYDSGLSFCSSGPASQAIAVNNSEAEGGRNSQALAVNQSVADTFANDTAVAVNNSEADPFFNSEGFAVNHSFTNPFDNSVGVAINNSFAGADTDSEAYALDHCGVFAFNGEQVICSGDLLLHR